MTTSSVPAPIGFLNTIAGAALFVTLNATAAQAYPLREFRPESSRPARTDRAFYREKHVVLSPWTVEASYTETVPDADAWLLQTMQTIEVARRDALQPTHILNQTEALAALFACLPMERRPILMFDENGVANFATSIGSTYFHLTLNRSSEISWILETNNMQLEVESQQFDGEHLPEVLMAELAR